MPQSPEDFLDSLKPKETPESFLETVAPTASPAPAPAAAPPADNFKWPSWGDVGQAGVGALELVGKMAHAGLEGAAGAVGLPGDLERAAFPNATWHGFPSSKQTIGDLHKAEDALLPAGGDLTTPSDIGEKYAMAAARGVGGGLVFGPASGMSLPAAIASGAGGGVGAEAGHDIAPGSKLAPILGGMAGGGFGAGVYGAATKQGLEKVAAGLGDSTSLEGAGNKIQEAARNWVDTQHKVLQSQAWAPVDSAIPGSTAGTLSNFQGTLQRLQQGVVLTPGGRIPTGLQNGTYTRLLRNPTWQNMAAARTQLGEELTKPQALRDTGEQNISQLYSALTNDMRTTAHGVSPDVGNAFDAANRQSQELFAQRQQMMKLYNPNGADVGSFAPGNVASKLLASTKKGGADVNFYRGLMPDEMDNLAAASLRGDPVFHKLSSEGQSALIPDDATREAAIDASKRAVSPSFHDTLKNENRAVGGILLGDIARGGAEAMGVSPGAAQVAGSLVPYAVTGLRRFATSDLRGRMVGGGIGEADEEPLTVHPKARAQETGN